MRELPTYATSDRFSALEKLVLDYATGISRSPVDVSDELFDRLREHFDEAQLVELTNVIALENYRARFNWAFGIAGQGFSEGAYCVSPEKRREVLAARS
jgi:alkylhydroperoxidase family enzyme